MAAASRPSPSPAAQPITIAAGYLMAIGMINSDHRSNVEIRDPIVSKQIANLEVLAGCILPTDNPLAPSADEMESGAMGYSIPMMQRIAIGTFAWTGRLWPVAVGQAVGLINPDKPCLVANAARLPARQGAVSAKLVPRPIGAGARNPQRARVAGAGHQLRRDRRRDRPASCRH